jgi:Domain of Unknown Function (DUF1543)
VDLYAVYLGGDLAPGRMGEDHEVVFVVGSDVTNAKRQAKRKWAGTSRPHIDAVRRLDAIDGYEISLQSVGGGDRTELDTSYDPDEP